MPHFSSVQVLMLRVAIIVFVKKSRTDFERAQETGIDEFGERAIMWPG